MELAQQLPFLVPQSALDGRSAIGAFAWDQVQGMLDAGVTWSQIPDDLRADHALAYYCGQVRGGGHSFFIGNARNWYDAGPERVLQWAAMAAKAYDLAATEAVIREASLWIDAHPKEAMRQPVFDDEVAPAKLGQLDTALYAADLVDEAEWWAEAVRLDPAWALGEREAAAKNRMTFPAPVVYLRQAAMLLNRARQIVAPEDYDAALGRLTSQVDGVLDERQRRMLSALADTRPGAVACAVSLVHTQLGAWPSEGAVLAERSVDVVSGKSVTTLEIQDGNRQIGLQAELAKGRITLFAVYLEPMGATAARLKAVGLLEKLQSTLGASGRADQQARPSGLTLPRGWGLRKGEKLAEIPLALGQKAFDLCDHMHVPEALAVHLTALKLPQNAKWRLLRSRSDGEVAQDWLIHAMGGQKFEVLGRADKVMIHKVGSDEITSYPLAELSAVRKHLSNAVERTSRFPLDRLTV